jgi:hypothetical protein
MGAGLLRAAVMAIVFGTALICSAQTMPATVGETLSGKRVTPAEMVRGHAAILVAGFSHDAGMHSGEWRKAVRADSSLNGIPVYELAMLEKAPGFIRGMIKSGMRKSVSAAEQDQIIVMTQDQKLWETFFGVADDKEPYVVLLDAKGDIIWHGHGRAATLEPQLRSALKQ